MKIKSTTTKIFTEQITVYIERYDPFWDAYHLDYYRRDLDKINYGRVEWYFRSNYGSWFTNVKQQTLPEHILNYNELEYKYTQMLRERKIKRVLNNEI